MKRFKPSFFATGALVSLLAVASPSLAQPQAPVRGLPVDQSKTVTYHFDDDPLQAGNLPPGQNLRVRARASRETILRPRVSFIGSLIRSVREVGGPYPAPVRVPLHRYSHR